MKFFSQNRFTRAFWLLFAAYPNLAATAATRPFLGKEKGDTVTDAAEQKVQRILLDFTYMPTAILESASWHL